MNIIITFLIGLTLGCVHLDAQENIHARHMERAHPTPDASPFDGRAMVPFVEESALPVFFTNVNMIVAAENDQLPTQNESSIAISPIDPNLLIGSAVDYRGGSSTWAYYSTDAGRTWSNVTLGTARPGWTSSNDPSVCFDHTGKGYLCYGGFRRTGNAQFGENGVFVSSTTDAGKTWSMKHTAVIIHTGVQTADSAFEDKYYIHVDTASTSPHRGTLYIPWKRVINRDSSTQIVITKSTDQGATWSVPVNVSDRFPGTSEATTFGQSFPLARTGPDGSVHLVWNSGTESAIRYARSTDAGATWTAPRIIHRYAPFGIKSIINGQSNSRVKGVVRAESYPTLTIDNTGGSRNGWMYLTWAADNYPNVYVSRSTDNGETWTPGRIVHSDTTNDQFWSWITLDPTNGDVAVMYADSRDDAQNILVRTYVSLSTDGGSTWTDRRAGDGNSDLRNNPFSGNTFAGDYSGCDFRNGIVVPSWVDMRNTVTNRADNDVYTALVYTRAPAAAQRFAARTLPNQPTNIQLSWDPVTTRAFGQPLDQSLLTYILRRDGQIVATLPGSVVTYADTGLTKYSRYTYALVAIAGSDTSTAQFASAFAGGSKQPAPPTLAEARGSATADITSVIDLPRLRLDSVTPLVNLARVEVFDQNGESTLKLLVSSDTGRRMTFPVSQDERGWYRVQARVVDSDGNASPASDSLWVFSGSAERLSESFDREPRYRKVLGAWGNNSSFFRSAPASFAHSPSAAYLPNRRDTLQLFPMVVDLDLPDDQRFVLQMYVAAFIDPSDTMFLEASTKGLSGAYESLEWWNASKDPRWSDTTKGDDAWRVARIPMPRAVVGDTVHLRLRFRSNASRQSDGFYMDDIRWSTVTSINEQALQVASIFPSPCSSHCTVTLPSEATIDELVVMDVTGSPVSAPWYQRGTSVIADVRSLVSGTYVLTIRSGTSYATFTLPVIR